MPRITNVTPEQLNWLRQHHSTLSYQDMAQEIGCCVDTLKRILARNNIQQFDGAKYEPPFQPPTWNRPCMFCKDDRTRPRWQYICDKCKADNDDDYA